MGKRIKEKVQATYTDTEIYTFKHTHITIIKTKLEIIIYKQKIYKVKKMPKAL